MGGTLLMLNLLIAMMSSTYEERLKPNAKDMNFHNLVENYRLKHSMALIGPPLNIVMFLLFVIVEGICRFLDFVSCKNGVFDISHLLPIDIDYTKNKENTVGKHSGNVFSRSGSDLNLDITGIANGEIHEEEEEEEEEESTERDGHHSHESNGDTPGNTGCCVQIKNK